ncbi:hypothetical protein IV203_007676 [Nitzschia inconspicua]|uniref:Uncharacterized protein n=1 Tax=Nitzschia inconspicua TaxID=303405 RepID=A0A9K3PLF7_9STRA|nr:hypothetical protein IV203_007676 [Nitzschia inconspicua]
MSSSFVGTLFFKWFVCLWLCCTTTTVVGQQQQQPPSMASTKDNIAIQNLYTCDDPSNAENLIPCDVDTNRWDITALDPQSSPDDSDVCLELVELLVDALRTETQTQEDEDGDDETTATVFEDILSTLVADYLEPCVIWAMEYGDLKQAAVAADGGGGMDDKTDDDAFQNDGGGGGGGVPLTTMSFEPLDLILVWTNHPDPLLSIG